MLQLKEKWITISAAKQVEKMKQIDFDFSGDALRDAGIALAKDHQDRVSDRWSERAYILLCDGFLDRYGHDVFTTEDLRSFAAEVNFELPSEPRAWASVIVKAKKEGIIKFHSMGFSSNPQAHRRPINIWIKA